MLMASGKHCFVIMPFSETGAKRAKHTTEYWTNFFSVIKPAVENLGYKCKRTQPGRHNLETISLVAKSSKKTYGTLYKKLNQTVQTALY
jgi:hypothetical protein